MYESLKGTLVDSMPLKTIVEVGGIAYRLVTPLSAFSKLPTRGQKVELFLSLIVREDSHTLYAFLAKEERDLFEILISVSGIGPKTAVAIIGHVDLDTFHTAVFASDALTLSKIPGIGKKTAEKLVLEMRDKLKCEKKGLRIVTSGASSMQGDAMNALIHLGYNPTQAQKAVTAVLNEKKEDIDLAKVITLALQKL